MLQKTLQGHWVRRSRGAGFARLGRLGWPGKAWLAWSIGNQERKKNSSTFFTSKIPYRLFPHRDLFFYTTRSRLLAFSALPDSQLLYSHIRISIPDNLFDWKPVPSSSIALQTAPVLLPPAGKFTLQKCSSAAQVFTPHEPHLPTLFLRTPHSKYLFFAHFQLQQHFSTWMRERRTQKVHQSPSDPVQLPSSLVLSHSSHCVTRGGKVEGKEILRLCVFFCSHI